MTITTDAAGLDLARFVKRGDTIVWGHGCGEPSSLLAVLEAQASSIGDLSAFTASSFSGAIGEGLAGKLALSSMGAIGTLRSLTAKGLLAVIPCHVGQIGGMIEQGLIGCDVAFVQVSPADADGNHSFGLISDQVQEMVAKSRVVIAEVNSQVPYTYCDALLPAARITCAVHCSRTPVEVQPASIGPIDAAIAGHAARYIGDGAILQTGVGAVPDAILRLLGDRKDLGVHSGMLGDGLVDLVEAGVITNAAKPIDRGVSINGALIGSRRLYAWAHHNRAIRMCSANYTHNPAILAQLPKLVTINSAIEVDLSGQINAEQSGNSYLGGTGGQVDFVRAGARSPGGHAIIALPATAKGGAISRIVATLSGPVTTARSEADVIVTEYGAAELRGQSLAERARRLITIAHPDFREDLARTAYDIARRGF